MQPERSSRSSTRYSIHSASISDSLTGLTTCSMVLGFEDDVSTEAQSQCAEAPLSTPHRSPNSRRATFDVGTETSENRASRGKHSPLLFSISRSNGYTESQQSVSGHQMPLKEFTCGHSSLSSIRNWCFEYHASLLHDGPRTYQAWGITV